MTGAAGPRADLPVAVGVADHETAVLDYAAAEADRLGCGLELVHAYSVPPHAFGELYGYDFPATYRMDGEEVLRRAQDRVVAEHADQDVTCVLTRGVPPGVLERASRSARLMVIGQDPVKPWYFRLYEGLSAHHLATHARCPVVIVPEDWRERATHPQVVALVDEAVPAHAILRFAFDTASARRSPVRIVHVTDGGAADDDRWHATQEVLDAWCARYADVRVEIVADVGDRRQLAVEAALGAALVVVGQPIATRPGSALTHSVAQALIARASCPVAVVPPRDEGTHDSSSLLTPHFFQSVLP